MVTALARKSPMVVSAQNSLLSTKDIRPKDRLIVALDVPTTDEALELADKLGDAVEFYKVGLELIIGGNYVEVVDRLVNRGKKIMLDGKFFDVPATVQAAVRQAAKHFVTFATVHGNDELLKAAVAEKNGIQILAVTVLTSLDRNDLVELGFDIDVEKLVLSRARRALKVGCDGVISSGKEAAALRSELGPSFLIVAPGIRPVDNVEEDDQKRVVTPQQAFEMGADYIVMGRPIIRSADPKRAAEEIQEQIAAVFEKP